MVWLPTFWKRYPYQPISVRAGNTSADLAELHVGLDVCEFVDCSTSP
jgi:hypothetical protein